VELITAGNSQAKKEKSFMMTHLMKYSLIVGVLLCVLGSFPTSLSAQIYDSTRVVDYSQQGDFEIGGVTVTGANFSDDNAITSIAGLQVGKKIRIPGNDIPKAIKALWKLRLFTDVQIIQQRTLGDVVFLEIIVQERPRLTRYSYQGAKKTQHTKLNEVVDQHLLKGGIVTDNIKVNASEGIEGYYKGKGFLDAEVSVKELPDSSRVNSVQLVFYIDPGKKVKIKTIDFVNNEKVADRRLRKALDNTKEKKRLFSASKLIADDYEADKKSIINFYNTLGYRDARIVSDSIWRNEDGELMVQIKVEEGDQYYFRNIFWKGNSIYSDDVLAQRLGIQKGDIYNQEELQAKLSFSQDNSDINALYQDFGYLFFRVDPIEVAIDGDSIDLEMRIFEGPQATIDKVGISGNDRTHEHVIRRELRTVPGQKFSRSDIIRSQREIINLGYFNPETLDIQTPVNPQRGTVDINYVLEERPSDQLELSAGWGGFQRVIGTLGVTFSNFSLRNLFNREAWSPLPMGDGQRFSLRAQTNGDFYQSYNISLTEPWLGGRKPNSLTVGGFYNRFGFGQRNTSSYQTFSITQFSSSLGTRLKWPDDNFISSTALNLQTLNLDNWTSGLFADNDGTRVTEGTYYNFSIKQTIARTTVSDPIYPRNGSTVSLSVQFTPPYSAFRGERNYVDLPAEERFRYLEYHKWRFDADWYTPISRDEKLVLKLQAKIGALGFYNRDIGTSPFERFQLGGDGINNQQFGFAGFDIISLRGYEVNELENNQDSRGNNTATAIFDKFTVELRYPLTLNPSSTIYVLAFAQGGNSWNSFRDFNPFDLKRSAGIGVRVFLPMFGTLGFDYGIGFDKFGARSLENLGDFNIILGFEPE
jgi:outer membrane protein insertion porin family